MPVITLDSEGLERVMSGGDALVEFFGANCPACRAADEIIRRFAEESGTSVYKVNVADAPDAVEKLRIMSVPTFVMFRDGRAVDRKVGTQSVPALRAMTDAAVTPAH